jgi:hypothetical protein
MKDPAATSVLLDSLRALLAFALPWLLGTLCLSLLPLSGPNARALRLGYGFLLGWLLVTLLMRLSDAVGLGLHPATLLLLTGGLMAGLLVSLKHQWIRDAARQTAWLHAPWVSPDWQALARWQQTFIVLLGLAIAVRLGGLWLEVYWRPLFPWDAAMHWATKARVWFSLRELVPFVDYDTWLAAGGQGVFTDNHPDYPPSIPLMQTWMALLIGSWNDALINLPWAGLGLALGLAFFAQARRARAGPLAAMVFSYLLLSLPLLNTQIALAGYADLFLGATLLLALMALHNWAQTGERSQALLALGFALASPLIKQEGLFWLLCFLPALAALWLPRPVLLGGSALAGLGLMLVIGWLPRDLTIAGHHLDELQLGFHPEAVAPLLNSLLVFGSWHLLFWLAGGLLLIRLVFFRQPWPTPLLAIGLMLGSAFMLMTVLFLGTVYANSMPGYTSISRITLHLAPGLVFFCLILYLDLAKQSHTADSAKSHSNASSPASGT